MIRTIVLTVAGSIAVVWLTVLGLAPASAFAPQAVSAFAGQSGTAVLTASYQLTPTAQLCSDFATWQRHPTTGNLDAVMTGSFDVAWKYVGEDAADLYRAVRSGQDDSTAVQYFYEDCNNGSGS